MKKSLMLAMAIAFAIASVSASSSISFQQQKSQQKKQMQCYVMKDGKMYHAADGKETLIKKEVTLKNGVQIMTNGSWKEKGKKGEILKNGECMDIDGKCHASHQEHHKEGNQKKA